MGVEKIEAGMLAISRAGHDKDTCYIVWDMDETYVWLVDGRLGLWKSQRKRRGSIYRSNILFRKICGKSCPGRKAYGMRISNLRLNCIVRGN